MDEFAAAIYKLNQRIELLENSHKGHLEHLL